jgi:hypothetical protein
MHTAISKNRLPEPLLWLKLFPRWSLITAVVALIIPIVFLLGLGQRGSDEILGLEYVELFQAVRNPGMFGTVWAIDAFIWLMLGGVLLISSGIIRLHKPIEASFLAVCAATQTFGALGSLLRFDGISDIALSYVIASPDQQAALLISYLDLWRIINGLNHIAVLFQGVGFLLVAFGFYSLRGFPRWLAAWFGIPGLLAMLQFSFFISGQNYVFVLNVLGLVVGNIALNLATTITLLRPPMELISALNVD